VTQQRGEYKGKYSLSPRFDSYIAYLRMSKILNDKLLDDAYRLATTSYGYLLQYEVYEEGELEDARAKELLRHFNMELRPWLDRIMLYIYPSDAAVIAREVLRRLREKKPISDIIQRLGYVEDVVKIVEALEGAKGRDYTIQFILAGNIDERRLEVARRVSATARLVGRIVGRRLVALRRIGPGVEPAGVGPVRDLSYELARLHPASRIMLGTELGIRMLATGELQSVKTYAIGSKGVEKPKSLGVVVDVSGSMSGDEIVYAAGIAIALFAMFRPQKRRLALFTSEVHEIPDAQSLLQTLLTVRAGGGTNISRAVDHVCRHWKDVDKIVLISDGRDSPPKSDCGVSYVIVTEDGWKNYGWKDVKSAWLISHDGGKVKVVIR